MVLVLLLPANAYCADDVFIDAGLGTFSTEGTSLSQVKFAKVGVQEDIWYALKQRFNGGGWMDTRGNGHTSSAFAGYQLGFAVPNDTFEMSIFSGPTLISSPDVALGGVFQFNETIFFGIRDKDNESIGIAYNHFSSAGIESPNIGRDFMCLEIKFPF